jgi:hypothetical protein
MSCRIIGRIGAHGQHIMHAMQDHLQDKGMASIACAVAQGSRQRVGQSFLADQEPLTQQMTQLSFKHTLERRCPWHKAVKNTCYIQPSNLGQSQP